jgi:hypothetical protein
MYWKRILQLFVGMKKKEEGQEGQGVCGFGWVAKITPDKNHFNI